MNSLPAVQKTEAVPCVTTNGNASAARNSNHRWISGLHNGGHDNQCSGLPIWLIPASRKTATTTLFFVPPRYLVPTGAEIVAVGKHDVFPIFGVAWVSDCDEVMVGIEAPLTEAGRPFLLWLWTLDDSGLSHEAILQPFDEYRAVAVVATGRRYQGRLVASVVLLS